MRYRGSIDVTTSRFTALGTAPETQPAAPQKDADMNRNCTTPHSTGATHNLGDKAQAAEDPGRRKVLRGALAMGCSLLIPVALVGCEPKPEIPFRGADDTTATPQAAKVSQASVQYQAHPNEGRQCSQCQHFIAESNSCRMVAGNISNTGWCSLWTAA
jgi:hypothetical protein